MQVPTAWFGYYFGGTMAGFVLGSYFSGRFSQRVGIDRLMRASMLLAALAGISGFVLAWAGVNHVAAIVLPMLALMFAFGCFQPLCFASALAPFPDLAGRASALLGFGQMMFASAGSFIAGLLHDGTAIPSMAIIAFTAAGAFVMFRLFIWERSVAGDQTQSV